MTNLDIHPGKKDIARLVNEDAVKKSIRNIVSTNTGERLFQPAIGADISKILFELADNDALDLAQDQILANLRLFEPRAKIVQVVAEALPDNNSISLSIQFSLINSEKTSNVNIILYRVR